MRNGRTELPLRRLHDAAQQSRAQVADGRWPGYDDVVTNVSLDRVLLWAGVLHLVAVVPALVLMQVDDRTLLGIDIWIKPAKFLLSIGIYLVTLAWMLPRVEVGRLMREALRWTFVITMIGESSLISMQAWRGVPSHFNATTSFDAAVFDAMGGLIAANTLAAFALLVLFLFRPRPMLPRAVLSGIRFGLLLFLVASGVGGMMVGQNAHAVGVADGGPGLPFVNWSTEGGDLRIAHFIGLHALQGLPILGWLVGRRSPTAGVTTVHLAALAWALLFGWTLWQAMSGRPLV